MRMSRRAALNLPPAPAEQQDTYFVGFWEPSNGGGTDIIVGYFAPGECVEIYLDDYPEYQDYWWHILGVGSWQENLYISVDFEYLDYYNQRTVTFIMPSFDVAVDVE